MRLLDVGCGSGAFSSYLIKLGFNVVGIDLCYDLIKIASEENRKGLFLTANALHLPFKGESFDVIFCGAFLHHLPDKLFECGNEFFRILRPGGKIYLFEPYEPCLNSLLWYRVLSLERTEKERAIAPEKLEQYLNQAGFINFSWRKIKKVRHIYYQIGDPLKRKIVGFIRKFFNYYLIPNCFFVGVAEKG